MSIFGHTHYEQYGIWRSIENSVPIGTYHVTGSASAYWWNNPTFRVYELDTATLLPLRVDTYYLDL